MGASEALRTNPIGIWTTSLESLSAPQMLEVASEIDELGFGSIWFGEAYGGESFTTALALTSATSSLVVGTGIANIYARGAMAAAAASRTINALAPGRFVMGLGVSHQPLVERDRGAKYRAPLAAMSDYLDDIAQAPYLGVDTELPPIVIAALGDKMLGLARDRTSGAHPYLVTPEHTRKARGVLGPEPLLVVEQSAVLGADREESLRRAHEHLSIYTGLPNYRNSWLRQGFNDSDFIRGGSGRLVDALVVSGGEEKVLRRAQEHLDAGADHVCIQILAESFGGVPLAEWRLLSEAVARH